MFLYALITMLFLRLKVSWIFMTSAHNRVGRLAGQACFNIGSASTQFMTITCSIVLRRSDYQYMKSSNKQVFALRLLSQLYRVLCYLKVDTLEVCLSGYLLLTIFLERTTVDTTSACPLQTLHLGNETRPSSMHHDLIANVVLLAWLVCLVYNKVRLTHPSLTN